MSCAGVTRAETLDGCRTQPELGQGLPNAQVTSFASVCPPSPRRRLRMGNSGLLMGMPLRIKYSHARFLDCHSLHRMMVFLGALRARTASAPADRKDTACVSHSASCFRVLLLRSLAAGDNPCFPCARPRARARGPRPRSAQRVRGDQSAGRVRERGCDSDARAREQRGGTGHRQAPTTPSCP